METPIHWHDVQKALGNDYINDISPIDPDSCQLTGAGSSKISVLHSNIYTKVSETHGKAIQNNVFLQCC